MEKKILIDATHAEEVRVAIVKDGRVEEFDVESQKRQHIKGNIYLARIVRIEPSLQAAFVDYGFERHGFLPFSEIHPDYYQIPIANRLVHAEEIAAELEEEKEAKRHAASLLSLPPDADSHEDISLAEEKSEEERSHLLEEGISEEEEDEEPEIEIIENEASIPQKLPRMAQSLKGYKIQEVIKRQQILLIQVVKEERGNKGAALTTYISLAGRYCILLPNILTGGGISRKIKSEEERERIKTIVDSLSIPTGMGVVVRTVGENKTKAEIRRDYEQLIRLWEALKQKVMTSVAPALIYVDGDLIKRAVRDMLDEDVSEVIVDGKEAYTKVRQWKRTFISSQAKAALTLHTGPSSLFQTYGIEQQVEDLFDPVVPLKSGGYIVINRTEALIAIDVNSGKSTRERNIEVTAAKTNLEAVEEVTRQLRLRDLSGLIVIDFIDMEETRHNRAVEARLRDYLKSDRAHIQIGRISPFGLLEMSRQRLRTTATDNLTQVCPYCAGSGTVRSPESMAMHVLRSMEEVCVKNEKDKSYTLYVPTETLLALFNQKRSYIARLEEKYLLQWFFKPTTMHMPAGPLTVDSYRIENELGQVVAPVAALKESKKDGRGREQAKYTRKEPSSTSTQRQQSKPDSAPEIVSVSEEEEFSTLDEDNLSSTDLSSPNANNRRRRNRNMRHRKKNRFRRNEDGQDQQEASASVIPDDGPPQNEETDQEPLNDTGQQQPHQHEEDAKQGSKPSARRWLFRRLLKKEER